MTNKKQIQSSHAKKLIGKLLMIAGLIGIMYCLIEPYIVHNGCFGYRIVDVLIYLFPIVAIIMGYRIYSKNE